jgi:hypothetical protein
MTLERLTQIMDAGADMPPPRDMPLPGRPELDLMASLLDDAIDLCSAEEAGCRQLSATSSKRANGSRSATSD